MAMNGPLALIILDGWGLREERAHNAVALAEPATFLDLLRRYPSGTLEASDATFIWPVTS